MKYINNFRKEFSDALKAALINLAEQKNIDKTAIEKIPITLEVPKDSNMGDLAAPIFPFAKVFHNNPLVIAKNIAPLLNISDIGEVSATGGYLNLRYNSKNFVYSTLHNIQNDIFDYGSGEKTGVTVVEFSSPNTNKPLHLGHLRNDALGQSVVNILHEAGFKVKAVDLINDRGVHICQSMLAYKMFHEKNNDTPETLNIKSDHFVGNCYVEFAQYAKDHPEAKNAAEEMLVSWESGDKNIRDLWEKMNSWAISGIQKTYERTGIKFDKFYRESNTYLSGKDIINEGLAKNIFFKATDNSIRCDVTQVTGSGKDGENREKVLLRSDGTSVYITQDIGTAVARQNDYGFSRMIYVVANEQNDHFKMLFYILKKLGYEWAKNLFHLSYGLVNLPSGRMKSREGTVVDADNLLDELHSAAKKIVLEKGYVSGCDAETVAEKIALSAVNYYLLAQKPDKDMMFNPAESLSFTGNTGPYIQYMGSRLASILRKASVANIFSDGEDAAELLSSNSEIELVKRLSEYSSTVERASNNLDPSIVAQYTYDLCHAFSSFYGECQVIDNSNKKLSQARLALVECTLKILKKAMALILIPYLEKM